MNANSSKKMSNEMSMDVLIENRAKIETIDKEMAKLLIDRMDASYHIGLYKKDHNLPVYDQKREAELIEKNLSYIPDSLKPYYKTFFQGLLTASKAYQKSLFNLSTIGYAGVEGSFAYLAALNTRPDSKPIGYPSFSSAFDAFENGEVDEIIVPFENSQSGDVGSVLDLLFARDVKVSSSYEFKIHQNLLALPNSDISKITDVYSKQEALDQCHTFLRNRNISLHAYANTAMAAEFVSKSQDVTKAAIASIEAANQYNLKVIASDIETDSNNTTRFVIISHEYDATRPHTGLLIETGGGAGQLAPVVKLISEEMHLSMSKLTSRPLKGSHFNYIFFVEIESSLNDSKTQTLILKLKDLCNFRIVGTF